MPRFRPSELMEFLRARGLAPRKGLSQNFLIDGNILRKMVAESGVREGDLVLEIGPGPGALTEQLLLVGAQVLAVEKDAGLAAALPELMDEELATRGSLEVFATDIQSFDIERELSQRLAGGAKARVIANLPYHLTSPILALLVPHVRLIASVTVMVQEEVARRMVALPGTEDYSSLAVFLQYYCEKRRYGFKVGRKCFMPAPKVDSAVVTLELREPPVVDDGPAFLAFMRSTFQQKRKMLRRSLSDRFDRVQVEAALVSIGLSAEARPEELSLEHFLRLWSILQRVT